MKGRHISNNIRLILDLIDYNEFITDNSCILFFVDFLKHLILSIIILCWRPYIFLVLENIFKKLFRHYTMIATVLLSYHMEQHQGLK